jgi:hypothetical protein
MVRRWCVVGAVVLSVTSLVVGCGHEDASSNPASQPSEAPPAAATPSPQTDVNHDGIPDADPSDQDWPGKMIVTYQDATSPEAIAGRDLMQKHHLLEDLADSDTQQLKLPYDIPVIGKQCDEANAFWSSDDQNMIICYEDLSDGLDIYTEAGDADPVASAINAEVATFYHETGHMVIHLYDLPATGREEDVADQLAAYMLLTPGPDGKSDPDSVQAIKDFAREFQAYSERNGDPDNDRLADVHSPDKTRMYNIECWIYGADPVGNADLVNSGTLPLPEDRADGCEDEYAKMANAWSTLLGPYLK